MGGNQEGLCLSSSCAVALFKRLLLISLQAFLYWTQKHQHHPPKNLQFTSLAPPPPKKKWQSKYRMYPRLWNTVARANGLIPVSLIFWFFFFFSWKVSISPLQYSGKTCRKEAQTFYCTTGNTAAQANHIVASLAPVTVDDDIALPPLIYAIFPS